MHRDCKSGERTHREDFEVVCDNGEEDVECQGTLRILTPRRVLPPLLKSSQVTFYSNVHNRIASSDESCGAT